MSNFETGATAAGANNLVLSVMNDGAVYRDRTHIVFAELQSAGHRGMTMRMLVESEAMKQRKHGSKFSARDISEAAKLVHAQTLAHCLETIREEWNGSHFLANALQWWDKVNGNTYFSVRIQIPYDGGHRIVDVPMQAGYGDHWKHVTIDVLRKIGFTMPKDVPWYRLPVSFGDAVYTRKAELHRGIYL